MSTTGQTLNLLFFKFFYLFGKGLRAPEVPVYRGEAQVPHLINLPEAIQYDATNLFRIDLFFAKGENVGLYLKKEFLELGLCNRALFQGLSEPRFYLMAGIELSDARALHHPEVSQAQALICAETLGAMETLPAPFYGSSVFQGPGIDHLRAFSASWTIHG